MTKEQKIIRAKVGLLELAKLYLIVAIDRTSKFAFVELHEKVTRRVAADSCAASSRPSPTGSTPSSPTTEPTSPIPPATPGPRPTSRT